MRTYLLWIINTRYVRSKHFPYVSAALIIRLLVNNETVNPVIVVHSSVVVNIERDNKYTVLIIIHSQIPARCH